MTGRGAPRWQPRDAAGVRTVDTLLNAYLRDMGHGERQDVCPQVDPRWLPLAGWSAVRDASSSWMRIDFPAIDAELYCPIEYWSPTGRHMWRDPLLVSRGRGALEVLDFEALVELVLAEYRAKEPMSEASADRFRLRAAESEQNLRDILRHRSGPSAVHPLCCDFLQAEQGVLVGHPFHPLAKSRHGFDESDLRHYSPEFEGRFPLQWFAAEPRLVLEDWVGATTSAEQFADELAPAAVLSIPAGWRLLPAHPWEASRLRQDPVVQVLLHEGRLVSLGAGVREYHPTTSLRTVWHRDGRYMFKLSTRVEITNCRRVNYLHEMRKGVGVARLLASAWGQDLARSVPELKILADVGFVTLMDHDRPIAGFGTVVRENPYVAGETAVVAALLAEPPMAAASPARLLFEGLAAANGLSIAEACAQWFSAYVEVLFAAVLGAYVRRGLVLEAHLQNILLELDHTGMPRRIHFRDNQGFFFRKAVADEVLAHTPELAEANPCIVPDAEIYGPFSYYLLVNNVLGLVQAFGSQGLCDECSLMALVWNALRPWRQRDGSGLLEAVALARAWPAKGNLRMALEDRDELLRPFDRPATYLDVDNPALLVEHECDLLIRPSPTEVVHRHHYPDLAEPLSLKSLDLEQDLHLVHGWLNSEHAKFWDMAGPLVDTERYLVESLASERGHIFVGSFGEQQVFMLETYWACRDVVGRFYPALPHDYGFHILVGPPSGPSVRGLTARIVQFVVEFFFLDEKVGRVVGEADWRNAKMERLLRMVGYQSGGLLDLPDKRAHLMFCQREDFARHCPDSVAFWAGTRRIGGASPSLVNDTARSESSRGHRPGEHR